MAATAVTLNDLEGPPPVAGLFKCNSSNICAAFYTISADTVLARFLCISRASCHFSYVLNYAAYALKLQFERVNEYGLTSHLTHNRSFRRRVFPGNRLLRVLTTKNKETKHYIHQKHKRQTEKPALANNANKALVWYVFYDLRPAGNGAGLFLPPRSRATRGKDSFMAVWVNDFVSHYRAGTT